MTDSLSPTQHQMRDILRDAYAHPDRPAVFYAASPENEWDQKTSGGQNEGGQVLISTTALLPQSTRSFPPELAHSVCSAERRSRELRST